MQFTLQTLLLSVVVIWSSMAAFGPWGLLVAGMPLAFAGFLRGPTRLVRESCALCGVLTGLLLLTAVSVDGNRRRPRSCLNNMKQLGLALHSYHDSNNHFPPACIVDENGKPMHSWRFLLLPHLEGNALYDNYDFEEPWNGPSNRRMADVVVLDFVCNQANLPTRMTTFVAVKGPGTAWADSQGLSLGEFPDGTDKTILFVEIANSDIEWMEPRDLNVEELIERLDPTARNSVVTIHKMSCGRFLDVDSHGIRVCFADGSINVLPPDIPPEKLRALFTRNGGEEVSFEAYKGPGGTVVRRMHWDRISGLVTLILSTCVLLFRRRTPTTHAVKAFAFGIAGHAAPDAPEKSNQ